jgi:hypothetical protein
MALPYIGARSALLYRRLRKVSRKQESFPFQTSQVKGAMDLCFRSDRVSTPIESTKALTDFTI